MDNDNLDQKDKPYIFKNLIEASTGKNLGETVEFDSAAPFSSHAAGELNQMSFDEVGARAKLFGARFRKMSKLCQSKICQEA